MKNFVTAAQRAAALRAERDRLRRAAEQGFQPETRYHGTMSPHIDEFPELTPENFPNRNTNEGQLFGPAPLYATDDPQIASQYSRIIYPGNINPDRGGELLKESVFRLSNDLPGSVVSGKVDRFFETEKAFGLEAKPRNSNSYVTSGMRGDDAVVQLRRQSSNVLPLRVAPQNTLDLETHLDPKVVTEMYDALGVRPNPAIFTAIAEGKPVNAGTMYYDMAARLADTPEGQQLGGMFVLNRFLRDSGYDSMSYRGGQVTGEGNHNVIMMLDPRRIRSENAQFRDPKSRNIMAGGAAAAVGAATMMPTEAEAGMPPGLTTSLFEKLPNQTNLKRATIEGILNQQGMKGAEKDMVMRILGDRMEISRAELMSEVGKRVPKMGKYDTHQYDDYGLDAILPISSGEDIGEEIGKAVFQGSRSRIHTLPPEFNVKSQTNHFGDRPDYFGHVRSFDSTNLSPDKVGSTYNPANIPTKADTRSIVEIQSDLFQRAGKTPSEEELKSIKADLQHLTKKLEQIKGNEELTYGEAIQIARSTNRSFPSGWRNMMSETVMPRDEKNFLIDQLTSKLAERRKRLGVDPTEFEKLKPFEKNWHERVIREEVRQAAKDGLKTMRVAHSDTVADVEDWTQMVSDQAAPSLKGKSVVEVFGTSDLGPNELKNAKADKLTGRVTVSPRELDFGEYTEIGLEYVKPDGTKGWLWGGETQAWQAAEDAVMNDLSKSTWTKSVREDALTHVKGLMKFYDKDVAKFLEKEYGAKLVTDDLGNKWYEFAIDPKKATEPVKVWGAAGAAAALGTLANPGEVKASPPETPSEKLAKKVEQSEFVKGMRLSPTARAIVSEIPNILIGASGAGGLAQAAADDPVKRQRGERPAADSLGPGFGLFIRGIEAFASKVEQLRKLRNGSK